MSEDGDQNEDQKKPLLTLAIELGDKKKQLLNIYLDSKPEQLAYDFCLQNNLDFDSMQNLTEEIKNALANYNADSNNQENKNNMQEEIEQNELGKNEEKENEEELENEENLENKENESGNKTEEVGEDHEQEEQVEQNIENKIEKEKEEREEKEEEKINIDKEEEEEKEEIKQKKEQEIEEEKENKDNKEEIDMKKEKEKPIEFNQEKGEEKGKEEEKSNKESENKEEAAAEEDLLKEEERDKVIEQNNENENEKEKEKENSVENNQEEEEDIPSYLSPTICFQNKQRQIVQSKPKPEIADFDTSYKKIDKISEFAKEKHEKVINYLTINVNNQKYLPKDYFDNPENKNFGERLYKREKILKEEAMEKARQKAKKENKKNEDNMTFIPKINDYDLIALQNRKQNKMQYNEEKRILNYKDYLRAKEESTKNKHYADIEKENTFAPKIDKNSEKMAGNRSLQIPRYEQLYKKKLDIKKLENKIYDNKNLFKPKINKNYKGVKTDNNNNKINEYANLTFEERQKRFKQKMEENKEKLIEIKNKNIDQKTGKKYFKPTINKNRKLDIERKNKKVFNELYRDSTKYQIKKEELVKKIKELEKGLY